MALSNVGKVCEFNGNDQQIMGVGGGGRFRKQPGVLMRDDIDNGKYIMFCNLKPPLDLVHISVSSATCRKNYHPLDHFFPSRYVTIVCVAEQ